MTKTEVKPGLFPVCSQYVPSIVPSLNVVISTLFPVFPVYIHKRFINNYHHGIRVRVRGSIKNIKFLPNIVGTLGTLGTNYK
jgi:hypothetical protein